MGDRRLNDVLVSAELEHYADSMQHVLFVTTVGELKRVDDSRLAAIGMSKPEIRRLRKFCDKEQPRKTLGKIKKMFSVHGSSDSQKSHSVHNHGHKSRVVIPESALGSLKTLGGGRYGTVQQGVWTTGEGNKVQVAVKCISSNITSIDAISAELMKTATILQCLDHDNLLKLYGAVITASLTMLVVELAPLRSLGECLRDPLLQRSFPLSRLHTFAQQVCSAMKFLESRRIVHGDLALKNVLVVSKQRVKVSDCCLSRIFSTATLTVNRSFYTLSCAWLAPESLNAQKFTVASDVWAFGVTLWEMFSYGAQPWAGWAASKVQEAVSCGHCLERPAASPQDHYRLMNACWSADAKSRPSFAVLHTALLQIVLEQLLVPADQAAGAAHGADYLTLRPDDIVTILDKRCGGDPGVWLGVVGAGTVGYFSPRGLVPYTDAHQTLVNSRSLDRKAMGGKHKSKRLTTDMISLPQNDFRHVAHIGVNGSAFGNISFLDGGSSRHSMAIMSASHHSQSGQSSYRLSGISTATSDSSGTLTEADGVRGLGSEGRLHVPCDSLYDDFIMSPSHRVDTGPSLVDEVFKAMGHQLTASARMADGRSNSSLNGPSSMTSYADAGYDSLPSGVRTLSHGELRRPPSPDYKVPISSSSIQQRRSRASNGSSSSALQLTLNPGSGTDISYGSAPHTPGSDRDVRVYRGAKPCPPSQLAFDAKGSSGSLSRKASAVTCPGTDSPGDKDSKKRMKMLKMEMEVEQFVPPKERNKLPGVKAMTPSEERELEEAMGMAARVATKNARDLMIPNSPGAVSDGKISDEDRSPRFHNVFSFTSKFRRQSSRDKSSLDNVQSPSTGNLVDEATVEAQEAYNVLVANGKGTTHSAATPESLGGERKDPRTKRPSQQQRPVTTVGDTAMTGSVCPQSRPFLPANNSHMRRPHGIPSRESDIVVTTAAVSASPPDDDENPLRMLRANRGVPLVARAQRGVSAAVSDEVWSPQVPSPAVAAARGYDDVPLPLPPRRPAAFSVGLNHKPRERKYPLVMDSTSSSTAHAQDYANTAALNRVSFASDYDFPNSRPATQGRGMTTRPVSTALGSAICEPAAKRVGPLRAFPLAAGGVVESISKRAAAVDDAVDDGADGPSSIGDISLHEDNSSYEDALDCALENADFNFARSEQLMFEEVLQVRQECGGRVSAEESMRALEEAGWDVATAVQLLRLRHARNPALSSVLDSHSVDTSTSWDASSRDTGYTTEPCPDSPDVVLM